jgi:hypothetical protein
VASIAPVTLKIVSVSTLANLVTDEDPGPSEADGPSIARAEAP